MRKGEAGGRQGVREKLGLYSRLMGGIFCLSARGWVARGALDTRLANCLWEEQGWDIHARSGTLGWMICGQISLTQLCCLRLSRAHMMI